MRDKTTKILFYPAKRNKKDIVYPLFNDFITGMNTNAAEMTTVMMTGPSIRSTDIRTM